MSEGPEPTPIDVPEHAIPATYRRAPRTERFIFSGVGIGALVGLAVGLLLPAGSGVTRGTAGLLVAIAGALAGGLISGAQVAYMEYTSGRSADRQRHDIETDWAAFPRVAPGADTATESPATPATPAPRRGTGTGTADSNQGAPDGSR